NKVTSCICGPNDDTITPRESGKLDYEVELGIVIGKRARYLAKDKAKDAIAGYFLSNDVSERVFQMERSGGQWDKGKGCETFGPIGPWFVTKDEIKDPQNLNMWLDVNGERRQRGNTRTMIFGCEHLVWYCSQFFVMEPGDIIITGTPPGVALGMKPSPVFLKPGDVVTLGIAKLGEQRQKIVAAKYIHRPAEPVLGILVALAAVVCCCPPAFSETLNSFRHAHGLPALQRSGALQTMAHRHAQSMAVRGTMDHSGFYTERGKA